MRLTSVLLALTLFIAITPTIYIASASNAAIKINSSDLCASVPLCTYWYEDETGRAITPIMTVTNNGFSPLYISGAILSCCKFAIQDVPYNLAPAGRIDFALSENPENSIEQKRVIKHVVVFKITKIGE